MLDFGFIRLAEDPGREAVFGTIGQMWKVSGGLVPTIRDAREFVTSEAPDDAKAAINFHAEAAGGDTELTTGTPMRRKFGRYWRVVRPGSAAIRRSGSGLQSAGLPHSHA